MFGLDRLSPTVLAVPPSYEPENVSVPLVAVSAPSVPPSEIPLIVELVRPELFRVPDIDGVSVRAPLDTVNVFASVRPLNDCVDVENVTDVAVVEA